MTFAASPYDPPRPANENRQPRSGQPRSGQPRSGRARILGLLFAFAASAAFWALAAALVWRL